MCLTILVGSLSGISVRACIWDRDTVQLETRLFPGALDVMTGRFPRHSEEFYRWRAGRVRALLAAEPAIPALVDDLAVAVHKLGRHQEAIDLLKESLKLAPHRYDDPVELGNVCDLCGRPRR